MRWRGALLVLGLLAGTACSDDDAAERRPRPPEELNAPAIDYSGVALEHVPGSTSTTIDQTGTATILGTVSGPAGLLPGATVRIERIVPGHEQHTDVLTGPDGRFELRSIPGGRYRVRAFLAPALGMPTADARFLRDGQEHTFDLAVTDQRAIVARAAVAPDPPYLDEEVNLAVVVATRAVDAEGIVRSTPVPGVRVELDGLGAWVLRTQDLPRGPLLPRDSTTTTEPIGRPTAVAFTDANGQARYELTCERAGPSGLSLLVSVSVTPPAVEGQPPPVPEQRLERLELALPECVDPASTVTSAPAADAEEDE